LFLNKTIYARHTTPHTLTNPALIPTKKFLFIIYPDLYPEVLNRFHYRLALPLLYILSSTAEMPKSIRYNPSMSKYFTGNGDQGSTGTLGKNRIPKSHARIRAVGAIDEASAALGMARSTAGNEDLDQLIQNIQTDLYKIMSQIVLEKPDPEKFPDLPAERVAWLEKTIKQYQDQVQDPKGFILPGNDPGSAVLSLTRAIIRRAEREVVDLDQSALLISKTALPYLNRLSSLIFVLELFIANKITPASPKKS